MAIVMALFAVVVMVIGASMRPDRADDAPSQRTLDQRACMDAMNGSAASLGERTKFCVEMSDLRQNP